MAYAALVSGIVLAQAGLGAVHGLASPLGAFFPIPHGVACGSLAAGATRTNIDALQSREPENPALAKYAQAGRQLFGDNRMDDFRARQSLVRTLDEWSGRLGLPRLSVYGMCEADIPRVVASCRGSSMKTNPVVPSDEEIGRLLQARL
jgi:alcohol dehydrogenase